MTNKIHYFSRLVVDKIAITKYYVNLQSLKNTDKKHITMSNKILFNLPVSSWLFFTNNRTRMRTKKFHQTVFILKSFYIRTILLSHTCFIINGDTTECLNLVKFYSWLSRFTIYESDSKISEKMAYYFKVWFY